MTLPESNKLKYDSVRVPELIRVSLLYDCYGTLLAEKQREAIEQYYFEDQTFDEIAKTHQVSRQAVFDALHHAIQALEVYEDKLGLVKQYELNQKNYKNIFDSLKKVIRDIENAGIIYDSDRVVDSLRRIEKEIIKIVNTKEKDD